MEHDMAEPDKKTKQLERCRKEGVETKVRRKWPEK
jgi:hypothetical protein